MRSGAVYAAWFATARLTWAVYNREFVDDRSIPGTMFNAVTLWLFLPAYPLAIAFLGLRWWRPATTCLGIGLLHVLWVAPLFAGPDPLPAGVEGAPRLVIASSNLTAHNDKKQQHLATLVSTDADVLLVQEYTTEWQQAFQDAGLFVRYPYRVESPQDRWTGTAILSRVPLVETEVWEMAGTFATRAAIVRGDAAVSLYSVHPEPPLFPFSRHQAQWHALIRKVETDRGNRVVAGDLNVTPFNAWYSELKDTGLRNCHEDRGRGSATTWNVQHRWFPPIRLDNVFYSSGVSCLSIDEVTGHGTDHEIVVAEVALVGR